MHSAIRKRIRGDVDDTHNQGSLPSCSEREPRLHSKTGRMWPILILSLSLRSRRRAIARCYNRPTGMHRKRAYFTAVFCLLLAAQLHAASHDPVAKRIDTILSAPDLARGFWGIEVVSLDSGKILYAHNADKLFTPASNTKLFTTAAALALIGPDYTCAPRSKQRSSGQIWTPHRRSGFGRPRRSKPFRPRIALQLADRAQRSSHSGARKTRRRAGPEGREICRRQHRRR